LDWTIRRHYCCSPTTTATTNQIAKHNLHLCQSDPSCHEFVDIDNGYDVGAVKLVMNEPSLPPPPPPLPLTTTATSTMKQLSSFTNHSFRTATAVAAAAAGLHGQNFTDPFENADFQDKHKEAKQLNNQPSGLRQ